MKRREGRDDHSVKVIQCKRSPCRAIGNSRHKAEDMVHDDMLASDERPARSQDKKGPVRPRHHRSPECIDLMTHLDG